MKEKNFITKISHNDIKEKLATFAEKAELRADQDKILKPPAFQSYYLRGKIHFEDNGTQNYLLFQSFSRYFKTVLIILKLQRGNQTDCLMRVLNLHQRLIIVLIQ